MSVLDLDDHAERVLEALEEIDTTTLRELSAALRIAGFPGAFLSAPLETVATDREAEEEPGTLARLQIRAALRSMSFDDDLRDRLDGIEGPPFWITVRDALVESRDDEIAHPAID